MYSGRALISSKRIPTYCPNTPTVNNCTPPKKIMEVMIEVQPTSALLKPNRQDYTDQYGYKPETRRQTQRLLREIKHCRRREFQHLTNRIFRLAGDTRLTLIIKRHLVEAHPAYQATDIFSPFLKTVELIHHLPVH